MRWAIHVSEIRAEDYPGEITADFVRGIEGFFEEFCAYVVGDSKASEHPGVAVNYRSQKHIRPVRSRQRGALVNENPICSWCREIQLDHVCEQETSTVTPSCRSLAFSV